MKKTNIIFGIHAVFALLKKRAHEIERLCIKPTRGQNAINELVHYAKKKGLSAELCSKEALDRMSHHAVHQGVVAHCVPSKSYQFNDLESLLESLTVPPFLLILDGIQDPHNLGACFRVADAAGVHAIIVPKDKSAKMTPVVNKVASGAVETVPFVQVSNLATTLKQLKTAGLWMYGATEKAERSVYQTYFSGPVALIMGSEGQGLRRLTQEYCDELIHIPMYGNVLSLNISVAAGILLFEIAKQRHQRNP